MACCPFHDDKTPSMKLDERYYCFGCHATGDAIDFVSNLFQISGLEAAKKIAEDFHLDYDRKGRSGKGKPLTEDQKKEFEMRQLQKDFRQWRSKVLSDLSGDYYQLTVQAERYAPTDREAPFSKRFVETLQNRDLVEYYMGVLETAPREAQIEMYLNDQLSIGTLHQKITHTAEMRDSVRVKLKEKLRQIHSQPDKQSRAAMPQHKAAAL